MKINIFKNPFVDVQVSMLLDSLDHARRKETEEYWRKEIAAELEKWCPEFTRDGIACEDCRYNADRIRKVSAAG